MIHRWKGDFKAVQKNYIYRGLAPLSVPQIGLEMSKNAFFRGWARFFARISAQTAPSPIPTAPNFVQRESAHNAFFTRSKKTHLDKSYARNTGNCPNPPGNLGHREEQVRDLLGGPCAQFF